MRRDGVEHRIIEAAKRVFARYGPKKTSMEDIAREANLSRVTLYNYFKSKGDILKEVIWEEYKELRRTIENALDGVEDPEERLKLYLRTIFSESKRLESLYNLTIENLPDYIPYIEETFYERIKNMESDTLKSILLNGISKGVFKDTDVDSIKDILLAFIRGINVMLLPYKREDDRERIVSMIEDIVLNGIKRGGK